MKPLSSKNNQIKCACAILQEKTVFIFERLSFDELILQDKKFLQNHLQCMFRSQAALINLRSERADVHSEYFPILQSVSSAQVGSQAGRAGEDATAHGF